MIKQINFEDKEALHNDEEIPRKNMVTDDDINEIKDVVNANAEELQNVQNLINTIEQEQQSQNNSIEDLQTDNQANKQDISNIKTEQQTQNSNIENLQQNKANRNEIPDVSNFITNTVDNLLNYYLKSETYTKEETNTLISSITKVTIQVVEELPQTGESNVIYLVPSINPKIRNVKDEYIYVNNAWEQIGTTAIDLTGYATETWVNTQIANFLTQVQIETLITNALANYYNKTEIDNSQATQNEEITALQTELEETKTKLERTRANRPTVEGTGESVTLNGTAEDNFVQAPLPMGNSEQFTTTGKNKFFVKENDITPNPWLEYDETEQKYTIKQGSGVAPQVIPLDIDLEVGDTITISIICESGRVSKEGASVTLGLYHTGDTNSWQGVVNLPKNTNLSNNTYTKTFTITAEVNGFMPQIYGAPTIEQDIVFKVQVEKSSVATSYEPYTGGQASPNPSYPQEINSVGENGSVNVTVGNKNNVQTKTITIPVQEPFCKVGNLADKFVKNNGTWYEEHWVKEKVFDGTNTIVSKNDSNANSYLYLFSVRHSKEIGLSNHFTHYNGYPSTLSQEGKFNCSQSNSVIYFNGYGIVSGDNATLSNANEFNNWLATQYTNGTPVKIKYILEEPEYIECTAEQSQILEQIEETLSYQDQTNIYSTDEISPTFEVEAYADITRILENLDSRLALLE